MKKTKNEKRFWNRWFDNLSAEKLEDYLISQAALWKEDRGKYSLEELQLMTFREIFGFEWCPIETKYTKLPLVIYVDEVGSYRKKVYTQYPTLPPQPKLMFINNYDNNNWDVIPVTISQTPEILEDVSFINVSHEDIEKVKEFIIKNYDLLMKHWKQKIHATEIRLLFEKVTE